MKAKIPSRDLAVWTALLMLVLLSPASAPALVPFPDPFPRETPAPDVIAPPAPSFEATRAPLSTPSPKPRALGGLSFTYARRDNDLRLRNLSVAGSRAPDQTARDRSNLYLIGLDVYALGCNLPDLGCNEGLDGTRALGLLVLRGAVGATEARSDISTGSEVLTTHPDGPTGAVGFDLAYLSDPLGEDHSLLRNLRLYASGSFSYSTSTLDGLEEPVQAYQIRPLAGLVVDSPFYAPFYLYGGASWESLEPGQATRIQGLPVRFRLEEAEPWSGVAGVILQDVFAELHGPKIDLRVEGEIGTRESVQATLRYEIRL